MTSVRELMRPRLRVPARRVNPSFALRLARLDPFGQLAQVLFLLPFLLDQQAAVVGVVALLHAELVLLDALLRARGVVVAEGERRIVQQAAHDLVARVAAERHPDGVAELVELDAPVAEALLLGVVAHLLRAVADLPVFVLLVHRGAARGLSPAPQTVGKRGLRVREGLHITGAAAAARRAGWAYRSGRPATPACGNAA